MAGEQAALLGVTIAGKYRIRRLIGTGGMGAVYEAEHIDLGKRVAVKIIDAGAALSSELTTRFKREARAASAVESEGIVQVFDVGRDPDFGLYMVMEMLHGEDLEMALRKLPGRRMDPVIVATAAIQIARALHKAHQARVIHRDLKPANIFLTTREDGTLRVKVLDFGISKLLASEASMLSKKDMLALTQEGVALGTPQYMSPEQAQGLTTVDHRSDVWGLGAVLYEALAGVPPYKEEATYEAVIMKILLERPPALTDVAPWVPRPLAKVVHGALEHDVKKRIQSCDELAKRVAEAVPEATMGTTGPYRSQAALGDQMKTEPRAFKPPVSAPVPTPRLPTDPPPEDTQVVVRPSNPNELAAAMHGGGEPHDPYDSEPSMTMMAEGAPSTRRDDAPPKVIVRAGMTPIGVAVPEKVIPPPESEPPMSTGDPTMFQKPAWIASDVPPPAGSSPTTKTGVAVIETVKMRRPGRSNGLMVGGASALGILVVGAIALSLARGSGDVPPEGTTAASAGATLVTASAIPATAAPPEPAPSPEPTGVAATPPATGVAPIESAPVAPSASVVHHHRTAPAPSASGTAPSSPTPTPTPSDGENPYAAPTPAPHASAETPP